uniref:uncharacterized protein LOC120342533 isoform X3 n=1 Tax=Styela clava TaxID=7725 RepID=UPI00193ADE0A|nr:uncharacterized protein LOC120342533 isoform X3 [Styela clava]
MSKENDFPPGLIYNRRNRSLVAKTSFEPPIMEVSIETTNTSRSEEAPQLVYNKRRHSAAGKNGDTLGLLPSFGSDKSKTHNRRHSLMAGPDALRRVSIDITDDQRKMLQLPRFSQVIDDLLYWDDDVLTDDGTPPNQKKELAAYELAKHKRRSKLTLKMADEVKDELKQLDFPRYKYVVNVMIGQLKFQGIRVASRCLWDTNVDNSFCVEKEGRHCFVTVLVHAIYYE